MCFLCQELYTYEVPYTLLNCPPICVVFSIGAKKSGAKGFFKGMGKGLVGVVAKPVSGVVDFASSTLEGIKGWVYVFEKLLVVLNVKWLAWFKI